jgi:hypothetical protein
MDDTAAIAAPDHGSTHPKNEQRDSDGYPDKYCQHDVDRYRKHCNHDNAYKVERDMVPGFARPLPQQLGGLRCFV